MIPRAWTTTTRSVGIPVADCIGVAPARSAPNRSAAKMMPLGGALAMSAMAIPSNPRPAETPDVNDLVMPSTMPVPASPANPPLIIIARIVDPAMLMPAYRAAEGLKPTARNSKPLVERNRSHDTANTAASPRKKPQFARSPSMSGGYQDDASVTFEIGSLRPSGSRPG